MQTAKDMHARRTRRVRAALQRKSTDRPRLSVFRSSKHIYAQIIDDDRGLTLVAASSIDKALKGKLAKGTDKAAATIVIDDLGIKYSDEIILRKEGKKK